MELIRKVFNKDSIYFWSVFVLFAFFASWFAIYWFYGSPDGPGTFGDQFGAINALFSGIAFVGLIYTIRQQHEDLKIQKLELKQNREEIKRQTEVFKQEQFENTFFKLLDLLQKSIDSLVVVSKVAHTPNNLETEKWTGRDVFRKSFTTEHYWFDQTEYWGGAFALLENFGIALLNHCDMTNRLTHYFSIIEEILQFIDNEGINMRQKKQYADFLKATLSNYELIWLFYYGLDSNNDSLRLLFEKYSFFEKIKFQFMPVCKEIKDSLRKIELNQQDLKDKDLHDYCLLYFIQDRHSKYGEKYSIDAFNGTNKDQFLKDRVELMQQIIRE